MSLLKCKLEILSLSFKYCFRENYLLTKSAEKLMTPVKMELDKLRLVAEERAANCNKGLAGVLGISNNCSASSPLSQNRSELTDNSYCPMSAISFKPGMSVYRPSIVINNKSDQHCPPTPTLNDGNGKRSRLSEFSSLIDGDENENRNYQIKTNLTTRFMSSEASVSASSSIESLIPFSPARASSQGINLIERETCSKKLASRQKQIEYGKNTTGYSLYTSQVPRNQRKRGGDHPWTPNKFQICSKRSWDGQVRKWRRALHKFDPSESSESTSETECSNTADTETEVITESSEASESFNNELK